MFETFAHIALLGIGATALADAWALTLKRAFQTSAPDFGLVGRWVAHMPQGRFVHPRIAAATPVRGERALGWVTHYAIGVAFAAAMIAVVGVGWLSRPTPAPALIFGLASVAAPFLIMQPAFGLGVAAARSPKPWAARGRSLTNHVAFGAGLYVSGVLTAAFLSSVERAP